MTTADRYFTELATAFVRGRLDNPAATIDDGLRAGLRLHKFKEDAQLPRVQRVIGIPRGLAPESLLGVASGRGTFPMATVGCISELSVFRRSIQAPSVSRTSKPSARVAEPLDRAEDGRRANDVRAPAFRYRNHA